MESDNSSESIENSNNSDTSEKYICLLQDYLEMSNNLRASQEALHGLMLRLDDAERKVVSLQCQVTVVEAQENEMQRYWSSVAGVQSSSPSTKAITATTEINGSESGEMELKEKLDSLRLKSVNSDSFFSSHENNGFFYRFSKRSSRGSNGRAIGVSSNAAMKKSGMCINNSKRVLSLFPERGKNKQNLITARKKAADFVRKQEQQQQQEEEKEEEEKVVVGQGGIDLFVPYNGKGADNGTLAEYPCAAETHFWNGEENSEKWRAWIDVLRYQLPNLRILPKTGIAVTKFKRMHKLGEIRMFSRSKPNVKCHHSNMFSAIPEHLHLSFLEFMDPEFVAAAVPLKTEKGEKEEADTGVPVTEVMSQVVTTRVVIAV
ncbi:hypothetical protein HK100_006444 [Physocladia obscura]|uniref:Uncharacterized protein n=1 Tax=Physocladia obscura TaxID=109957 RepID=A0AAD5SQE9_9FUNG|nr:hypothetical protein HK100_006444 [Physocladia obscura]